MIPVYYVLLEALSSFGYVIGATHQCSAGCFDDCLSLEHDPPCFGHYYMKQLEAIDLAKENEEVMLLSRLSTGV